MKENYITIGNRIQNNTVNPETKHPYPNIDKNYGPYKTLDEAYASLPMSIRSIGLKFAIYNGTKLKEYIFDEDIENANEVSYGGESSYTAGNLIIIDNNVINVDPNIFKVDEDSITIFNKLGHPNIEFGDYTKIYNGISNSPVISLGDEDGHKIMNITSYNSTINITKQQTNTYGYLSTTVEYNARLEVGRKFILDLDDEFQASILGESVLTFNNCDINSNILHLTSTDETIIKGKSVELNGNDIKLTVDGLTFNIDRNKLQKLIDLLE